ALRRSGSGPVVAGGGGGGGAGGGGAGRVSISSPDLVPCASCRMPSTDSSLRLAAASNTSLQWPQRTLPSEIFSWSVTTRNIVPQAGQLVIRLMSQRL